MPLIPLSQVSINGFQKIRLIATDMDGTLTTAGKFTPELLRSLQRLSTRFEVLIVTGRSAGWVSGLASYLPVVGAIAENGGLFYSNQVSDVGSLLVPIPDLNQHRQKLAETFRQLQTLFPNLEESSDNRFRLTDWTFDVAGLSLQEIETIAAFCHSQGWSFTYSNVQCHIKPLQQNKADGLLNVLKNRFAPDEILTVGDSPNDESLFDARVFPTSVGVANVLHYADQLMHKPAYVTIAPEGKGFCELATALMSPHTNLTHECDT
jgi:HAD superfamily hydrolase (TIGR01484 family)